MKTYHFKTFLNIALDKNFILEPNSYKANLILSGGDHSSQFFKSNIGSSNSKFGYLFEILHDKNSGFKSLDYINGNTGFS